MTDRIDINRLKVLITTIRSAYALAWTPPSVHVYAVCFDV